MQTNNTDPFWPDNARLVISISMQMEAGAQPESGAESPLPKIDPKYPDIAATKWYEYGFKEGLPRLLDMFEANEASSRSATWWPADQTVGFWARRMAHETAVHRVDAELARGAATPVDASLAADGVDEILHIMLAGDWSEDADDAMTGQRVAIETGGRAWQVVLDREAMTVLDGDGTADATLSGSPSDVLLWLWGREPDDRVEMSGDQEAHRLMRTRLVMATQ